MAGCRWTSDRTGGTTAANVTGKTQSAVASKVKTLEQARGTGAVAATGRTTLGDFIAEWVTRKERLHVVRSLTLAG
jgi:hypothetical protein